MKAVRFSKILPKKRSQSSIIIKENLTPTNNHNDDPTLIDFSIREMLDLSKQGQFPQKAFKISNFFYKLKTLFRSNLNKQIFLNYIF